MVGVSLKPMPDSSAALNTRQQALLEALNASSDEMSRQQLHRSLEGGRGAMGLATVYRNLRQLQRRWLEDWHTHHAEVLRYFHAQARQQFLLFHISETPVGQLNRFLERHFELSCRTFPHHHRSA